MPRKPNVKIRQRILEEAEHLIHLHGYRGTSLEEIASRLKMTKANLLHHFKSKEELGLAVVDYKIGVSLSQCLKPLLDMRDPIQAVQELFAQAGRFYRTNGCKAGCFIGNIALEMSDINDRFRERVSRFFEEWVAGFERNLRRRKSEGFFAPTLKPRAAAEAILALYEGAIMQAKAKRAPEVFDRVGRETCRLLEAHRIRPKEDSWDPRRPVVAKVTP